MATHIERGPAARKAGVDHRRSGQQVLGIAHSSQGLAGHQLAWGTGRLVYEEAARRGREEAGEVNILGWSGVDLAAGMAPARDTRS